MTESKQSINRLIGDITSQEDRIKKYLEDNAKDPSSGASLGMNSIRQKIERAEKKRYYRSKSTKCSFPLTSI